MSPGGNGLPNIGVKANRKRDTLFYYLLWFGFFYSITQKFGKQLLFNTKLNSSGTSIPHFGFRNAIVTYQLWLLLLQCIGLGKKKAKKGDNCCVLSLLNSDKNQAERNFLTIMI